MEDENTEGSPAASGSKGKFFAVDWRCVEDATRYGDGVKTPIEHSWPPEMLAEVFPERYGHLVFNWTEEEPASPSRYTVDHLPSGCVVIGLSGGQAAWRAAHKPETSSRG